MSKCRCTVLLLALASFAATCGSPFAPSKSGQFSWTVDGRAVQATSNGLGALRGGQALFLDGWNCSLHEGISIQMLQGGANVTAGTYQAGDFKLLAPGSPLPPISSTYNIDGGRLGWLPKSGALTISSVSSDKISGTFSFEMEPDRDKGNPPNRLSVQGTFVDVPFRGGKIC